MRGVLGRVLAVALIAAGLYLSSSSPASAAPPIARAWGERNEGELGIGSTNFIPRTTQTAVRNAANNADFGAVDDMDGGNDHAVWLKGDGTVHAAGDDSLGQLGNGAGVSDSNTPVQLSLSNVLQVDAGSNFTLALVSDGAGDGDLTDGDVWGWGHNSSGQIGAVGTGFENSEVPVAVVGAPANVIDISAAGSHSLAVTSDNTAWAWGHNIQGQLGNNTSGDGTNSNVPAQVHDTDDVGVLSNIEDVDAGTTHSLARGTDGSVYAWGSGGAGQIGDGTANSVYDLPTQVHGVNNVGFLDDVVQIAAGGAHNLARISDGSLVAWGNNSDGQTGDNRPPTLFTPKQVLGEGGTGTLSSVDDIAAGTQHSLAVVDGDVFAWGANSSCQAGQGTCDSTDFSTPIPVLQLVGATNVEAGTFHSFANADADTAAPTGTVSIDNDATYATSTSVVLSLTSDDGAGVGVESMRFSNDGTNFTAWEPVAATKSHTLASGDGSKTVRVQFRDAVGNVSASFTDDITLDETAPTGSMSIDGGVPATNSTNVTLTLSASDGSGSGVSTMAFSDDGSTFTTPEAFDTTKAHSLPGGDGTKTVYARYADAAGNTTDVFDSITLDTAAPTGTISVNNGAQATTTPNVTLNLSADGTGTSIADMAFSDDGTTFTSPEAFSATKSYTLPTGDGTKTVFVRYRDLAGNSVTVSDTIVLDTTAPTVIAFSPTGKKVGPGKNVMITFSEDMDASTLTAANVGLFKGSSQIAATLTYNAGTDVLILDPAKKLKRGKKYRVMLTTGVEDASGVPLAQAFSWTFRTRT